MQAADMPKIDVNAARLDVLIARMTPRAVVLRRGPTRHWRMLAWNLKDDTIEPGQWVKAKIYSRRCDLSPDGEYLAYFAARFSGPLYSWTAISRPPYFTALALWPKDDAWGGGALFDTSLRLSLNHTSAHSTLKDGYTLQRDMRVAPLGPHSGGGEDYPFFARRMTRDGWIFDSLERASNAWQPHGSRFSLILGPPHVRKKPLGPPRHKEKLSGHLRVVTHAMFEKQGRHYGETADIIDADGAVIRDLGRIEWADIDHNGDVLYAIEGRLYRLSRDGSKAIFGAAKLVADLNDMKFEAIRAPEKMRRW